MARLRADSEGFVLGTPRCVIGDGSGDSLRYRHPAQCHHGACNLAQVQVWSIGNIGSESGLPPPWRGGQGAAAPRLGLATQWRRQGRKWRRHTGDLPDVKRGPKPTDNEGFG